MGFDKERFQQLKREAFESGGFTTGGGGEKTRTTERTEFDLEDLKLLDELKRRTKFYPLLYAIPCLGLGYLFTAKVSLGIFRNPLKQQTLSDGIAFRRVKQIYFLSFALITTPMIYGYFTFQYHIAEKAVFKRYKGIVDRYVYLRDELIFENLILGDDVLGKEDK